jgi:hypothetical protein
MMTKLALMLALLLASALMAFVLVMPREAKPSSPARSRPSFR